MRLLLLLLVLPVLSACSGFDIVNAGVPDDTYRLTSDIAYAGGTRHGLDIYEPVKPAPGNPVILFIYGGNWRAGAKADYRFAGEAFASRGITTVIADYRLVPQVRYPAFVEDGAAALRWVHANIARYGGNPDRIFVAGHSAGAYNALMLALDPRFGVNGMIRGAIGLAGPYDFLPLDDDTGEVFGHVADAAGTQPITYANSVKAPILLLHGTDDETVEVRNSRSLAAKLRGAGSPVAEREYADKGHISVVLALADHFRYIAPVLDDISAFVTEESE